MNTVRKSFRTRKYLSLQEKENPLFSTPEYVRKRPEIEDLLEEDCSQCAGHEGSRRASMCEGRGHEHQQPPKFQRQPNRRTSMISTRYSSNTSCSTNNSTLNSSSVSVGGGNPSSKRQLSKSASVRLTVRDAVHTLRRKISSTAQLMSQGSLSSFSSNITARRRSMRLAATNTPPRGCQHRQIKMYSPFEFATPEKRKTDRKWCDTETPTKLRREVEALTADMQALASLTPNTLRTRAAARRQNSASSKKNVKKLTSSSSIQLQSRI